MSSSSETRKSLRPRFIGRLLLGIGAGTTGGFMMRQMQEADAGHTYYGFITAGAVCAVIGLVVLRKNRRDNG